MSAARQNLLDEIAGATTPMLIATYRRTDEQPGPIDSALAVVRGAICNELGSRMPGVLDEWCDRLDAGENDVDLMALFEIEHDTKELTRP